MTPSQIPAIPQKLLDYAALRLSSPQLAEFTNALIAPDRITPSARQY